MDWKATLPLWVVDVARRDGHDVASLTEAKTTAKQSVLTLADGSEVKVYKRNAFPGRVA